MVELVLHRPRAEPAEALGVLGSAGVEVGHLHLGRAGEEAAEVGDAEAALVALVGLVAERTDDRVDEDAEAEARLVRVARVVADLDGEDPQRDVDLRRREAGAVRRAHRLDQVVADAEQLGRAELVVAHLAGSLPQRRMADLHDREGGHGAEPMSPPPGQRAARMSRARWRERFSEPQPSPSARRAASGSSATSRRSGGSSASAGAASALSVWR